MKDRGRDSTRSLGKMWCQQEASSCLTPRRALEYNHRVDPALKQGAVFSIPVSSAAGCFTGAGSSREEGGTVSPARFLPPVEKNSLGEGALWTQQPAPKRRVGQGTKMSTTVLY